MGIIDPRLAVLDETDSGLDIDALRVVGDGINRIMRKPDKAVLLITHYQRLLDLVVPDFVHVLADGRIVRSGGPELAHELEREGYAGSRHGATLARARMSVTSTFRADAGRRACSMCSTSLAEAKAGAGATSRRCPSSPTRQPIGRGAGRPCPGSTASMKARACCSSTAGSTPSAAALGGRSTIGPVDAEPATMPLAPPGRPRRLAAAARPRPCAARPRPDRPRLDRRRRPSRRRDRARRRRPGLGRRDLSSATAGPTA